MVLLADDGVKTRVSLCEPVQRPVVGEGRAYENDVIERAAERAAELVHKKLRLARIRGTNDERVERDVIRVHFLILHIVHLVSKNVKLRVGDHEHLTVNGP